MRGTGQAVDTSVLVAALLTWHPEHEACRRLANGAAIPAHVLFETYSVLTRLPGEQRSPAPAVRAVLDHWLGRARALQVPAGEEVAALEAIAIAGIEGGATYDGLIGWTARRHGVRLVSRDLRAARTYDRLGVAYDLM